MIVEFFLPARSTGLILFFKVIPSSGQSLLLIHNHGHYEISFFRFCYFECALECGCHECRKKEHKDDGERLRGRGGRGRGRRRAGLEEEGGRKKEVGRRQGGKREKGPTWFLWDPRIYWQNGLLPLFPNAWKRPKTKLQVPKNKKNNPLKQNSRSPKTKIPAP